MSSARSGVAAQAAGLGVQVVLQLATIPIFLRAVGTEQLGLWLVLTALPTYLALSDLGLIGASATEMLRRVTRGDRAAASRLASATATATLIVFALLLAVAGLVSLSPLFLLVPGVTESNLGECRLIVLAQVGYVLLLQQTTVVEACYRAVGQFATGIFLINVVRLAEFAGVAAVLVLSHSLTAAALSYLVVRLSAVLLLRLALHNRHRWIEPHFDRRPMEELRPMLRSGLGYLSFPVSAALSVQAITLVVAALLGPVQVVVLASLRIGVGLIRQLCNAINYGAMPRLTQLLTQNELRAARRLGGRLFLLSAGFSCAAAIVIAVAGPSAIDWWTRGAVAPSRLLVVAMAVTVVADVPLLYFSTILLSANAHARFGFFYVVGSLASVVVAAALMPAIGLLAVPIGLLAVDCVATPTAVRGARLLLAGQSRSTPGPADNARVA